jgi:3-hydroxyacyl-[acyl-carrier-protein] dehydratase
VPQAADESSEGRQGLRTLFDLSGIDLSRRLLSRQQLERYIPHRGNMAMVDWLIWNSPDYKRAVGLKHVRADEFWVPGHFPDKPMLPGVLMVETGAQLACYAFNARGTELEIVAFLRIENAAFRSVVVPGDDLYLLVNEKKFGRRAFESDIQGFVGDRIAFDATISGMRMPAGEPGR